ncbi:hypothetical protein [Prescottella equi]|uniref:hypothetical protein n=1 Tax=Rhodococcus hoagii TaxID=43767 RepID=UPI001982095C|nr:hypothetical protein [Prescottella equi]NKU91702.1 hypothetical protein [Prescottella equi]
MSDRDVIDDIDALVDEQMAGYRDRSGYDHNVNQDRCWHCGEDWHGLAITARMEEMRRRYRYRGMFSFGERDYAESALDPEYRYAEDDSEVLCPGSDFIGPWATPQELNRIRNGWDSPWHRHWGLPESPPGFHAFDFRIGWRDPAPRPAGFNYHLPADVESSGHIAGAISDGPPQQIGRDFAVGGAIPPEEQFPPEFGGFAERIRRQHEEIWQHAADMAVPSASYQPMQRLVAGDRIVIESEGRRHEVVVLDVQQRGDRIEYTTADPRFSARARALASVRDGVRRMGDVAPSVNDALNRAFSAFGSLAPAMLESLLPDELWAAAVDNETAPETPQQRALPRPSTTPPMWAVQPNRRNRRRNR